MKSENINELATALAKAQGEMRDPEPDAKNPFFNSEYTTLGAVLRATRPLLMKHGLSVSQCVQVIDDNFALETVLMHSSGQWISSLYPLMPVKNDPQGFGSCLTYARRYSYKSVLGCAESDDDGNDHVDKKPQSKSPTAPPKPQQTREPTTPRLAKPSEAQLKRLHAIAATNKWSGSEVAKMMGDVYKIKTSKELTLDQYNELCDYLEKNKPEDMGQIPH